MLRNYDNKNIIFFTQRTHGVRVSEEAAEMSFCHGSKCNPREQILSFGNGPILYFFIEENILQY